MSYKVIKNKMENGLARVIGESFSSRQEALREFASITSNHGYYRVSVIYEDHNGRKERIISKTYPENMIERR